MIIITIIIVLFSLIALLALHELGHFLLAKKFGVKVPEFGIGYPPRIWGKKIGDTLYSINWLPFGAFVKILGEDGDNNDPNSFTQKPLWQRALILSGGVVTFWIVAIIILTFVTGIWGVPTAIDDDFETPNARVQIFDVAENSPAELAGIEMGDTITGFKNEEQILGINTVIGVQGFVSEHLGEEIILTILRGSEEIDITLTPRENTPEDEGAMGVALLRVADLKTTWYKAPWQAVTITYRQSKAIPIVLYKAISKKIQGEKVTGVKFVGPIGVGQMMGQALSQGVGSFLTIIVMIAIWLALFNLLPIPALDGGRLLFIAIEAIRRKPMRQSIEQGINSVFFLILIGLMIIITLRDVIGLF